VCVGGGWKFSAERQKIIEKVKGTHMKLIAFWSLMWITDKPTQLPRLF
jgi:hypothetical protein